ncbi:MAG TPA: undecaprenyldiphospho-muramoylpentapeptide beta-N-acetylglucosaminyltransferase [Candidatus Limnocylindrales bacterium]|nr:undecaprenyldiphospho-muramoylpentapeptide beta-N-acetylglucosaminyltransferase [Candidatus Limnocylindrales bacterium]
MRVLIGGGGTGGHIYPALALARYALTEDSMTEILFVGTARGLENKIVPSSGFNLAIIPARGFQRNSKQLSLAIKDNWGGLERSRRIISDFKPDIVLGTGGYVAFPLVMAAIIKHCPVVIHEQNALPGLTNRWLAPLVNRVCLSFFETRKKLSRLSRIQFTGNPRASEVHSVGRAEGCRYFGLAPEQKNILIYGGSRGSLKINQVVTEYLKANLVPEGVNLIYVTGDDYYQTVRGALGQIPDNVKLFPYLEEMPMALAAADLAVTRSGATTLAEVTALGVPVLLIPSPNVVNNHQYHNARLLSDAGAAVLIDEKELDHTRLQTEINRLLSDPILLDEMSRQSKAMGVPDAARRLYQCMQAVISEH